MKALLLLFCLVLGPVALAADGLTIESCSGSFGTKLGNNQWNNWEVTVVNAADHAQAARVLFRVDRFNVSVLREVQIPANTRYPVRLGLFPEFPAEKFEGFFKATKSTEVRPDGSKREVQRFNGNLECIAALVDAKSGQERSPFKVLALLAVPGSIAVAVIDDEPEAGPLALSGTANGLPYLLGDRRLTGEGAVGSSVPLILNEQFPEGEPKVQISYANSSRLPDAASAYEGTALLVLGNHRKLNPAQQIALRQWIYGGGRLAVFPAGAPESYRPDSFWQELLPVTLTGSRDLLAVDTTLFEKDFGGKIALQPLQPVAMAGAFLKAEAELLGGTATSVLSAKRSYGAGEVFFFALRGGDIKSAGNAGTQYFKGLTAPQAKPLPGVDSRFRKNAANLLQTMTGLPVPQKWEAATLMLVFLTVGSVILVVLRIKKRAELGWPLLMGWSLLVFLAASVLMRAGTSGLSLSSGEIGVTLVNGGCGVNQTTAGAFPFDAVRGALSWRQPGALLAPAMDAGNALAAGTVAVWQDFYPGIPQVQMQQGQFWSARSIAPAGGGAGVRAQLSFTGSGIRGSVQNRSGQDLKNCLISLNRRILYLGDLADGATADLARAELLSLSDFVRRDFGSGWDGRRNILSQLLYPEDVRGGLNARPVLLAFTDGRLCDFSIDGRLTRNNARQLIATLPELSVPAETEAIIPAGVCGLEFSGAGSIARGCYGYPVRPLAVAADEGMSSRLLAAQQRRPGAPAAPAPANKKTVFDPEYDCAFPGWIPGNTQTNLHLRYTPPAGLSGFRATAASLVFKGALTGLTADVFLTRPGSDKPQKVGTLPAAGGTLKLDPYASFVGKDGAAPEIEVRMKSQNRMGGDTKWEIQELELQMTGKTVNRGNHD